MSDDIFANQVSASGAGQRAGFHVPPGFAPPAGSSLMLQIALSLFIAVQLAVIVSGVWAIQMIERLTNGGYATEEAFNAEASAVESFANILLPVSIGAFVICVIAYCVFVFRAASNIQKANAKGLDHGPGWAVGLSFIPIANLVFIFVVMRGLWVASHEPRRGLYPVSILLPLWWGLYVICNIGLNITERLLTSFLNEGNIEAFMTASWATTGLLVGAILSAVLLILIVRGVTRAQAAWPALAQQAPAA